MVQQGALKLSLVLLRKSPPASGSPQISLPMGHAVTSGP